MNETRPEQMIVSFRLLRLFLGCLGLALPVALVAGGFWSECCVRPSISAFYYSSSPILHSLFVGTMVAIGAFLVCYKGHAKKTLDRLSDNVITTGAGIGAFGIALFPTGPQSRVECWGRCFDDSLGPQNAGWGEGFNSAHLVFSLLFFAAIFWMAGVRFARSNNTRRRAIYRACAVVILICIIPIAIDAACPGVSGLDFDRYSVVFGLEALAVWAFGTAWLTKGWPKK